MSTAGSGAAHGLAQGLHERLELTGYVPRGPAGEMRLRLGRGRNIEANQQREGPGEASDSGKKVSQDCVGVMGGRAIMLWILGARLGFQP